MTAREILRRHLGFIAIIVAIELAFGWEAARMVVGALRRDLPIHPDGLRALLADGGRGAIDFVLGGGPERVLTRPAIIIGSAMVTYFLVTRVTETLIASTFAAGRRSVKPFGRVLVVHLVVGVAFGALGFATWLGVTGTREIVARWFDRRAADLVIVASLLPPLAVALVLQTIDDLAVLRAGAGDDLLESFSTALHHLRSSPLRLVAGRIAVLVASLVMLLIGAAFSWRADRTIGLAVIACIVMQQLSAASRILFRLGWLAHLASFWRTR